MMALPNGPRLIAEYYRTASAIVAAIAVSPHKSVALRSAWAAVRNAVSAIEKGDYHAALTTYTAMFRRLKRAFLEGAAAVGSGERIIPKNSLPRHPRLQRHTWHMHQPYNVTLLPPLAKTHQSPARWPTRVFHPNRLELIL
jgi:hypothetical protein